MTANYQNIIPGYVEITIGHQKIMSGLMEMASVHTEITNWNKKTITDWVKMTNGYLEKAFEQNYLNKLK